MNIGFAGRWTNPSDLRAPPGAAATADNIVVDRPGIAQPRRGFDTLEGSPTITGPINAGVIFSGSRIVHHSTGSISRWTGSAWSTYSGTYSPPDAATPITFKEAEGSLFVTTSAGLYELDSPTGTWRKTGAPAGLDGTATLNRTSGTSGWAAPDHQWAYRDVWVYRNGNNRLQFGAPSGRMVVVNPAAVTVAIGALQRAGTTVTATVISHSFVTGDVLDLSPGEANFAAGQKTITGATSTTFTYTEAGAAVSSTVAQSFNFAARLVTRTVRIPAEIATSSGWVAQVYRSAASATASDPPPDAMGLVVEKAPTNLEISTGYMTVTDYAPDSLRGATLYTTEQGAVAAKAQPPVCHDFTSYRQSYWCADTNRTQSLQLTLLAVGGTNGLAINNRLWLRAIAAPNASSYYAVTALLIAATSENALFSEFKLYTSGTAAQNIADTAQSIVRVINASPDTRTIFRAFYVSRETDYPGQIRIETLDSSRTPFSVVTTIAAGSPPGDVFAPDVSFYAPVLPGGLVRVGSTVTVTCAVAHGLAVGQQFQLEAVTPDANFSAGTKTVASVTSSLVFTYTEAGGAVASATEYGVLDHPLSLTASQNDDWSNSLHYSPPDEPWAFPEAQQLFVGSRGSTIYRLIPTADRLLVWTSNGLYKVTGTFPYWQVSEVDVNLKLLARGLAGSLGDRGYGYTDQGFVEALDTAVVKSIPIEQELRDLQATAAANVALRGFAVSYESDRRWLAWMPSNSSDTYATQAQVWNKSAEAWTRWPVNATAGWINPTTDRLELGTSTGAVWIERKDRVLTDYQDPSSAAISSTVEWLAQADPPDSSKLWQTGGLDFKSAQFSSGTLYFATDLDPTYDSGTTLTPPLGSTTEATRIPFWVSAGMQRGMRLKVKWSHSSASASYALQGLNLKYRVTKGDGM